MRRAGPQAHKFAGGHRSRVTPVPIPNTEVKPDTADGTVWETVWESRSLPALILEGPIAKAVGPFLFPGAVFRRVSRRPAPARTAQRAGYAGFAACTNPPAA